MGDFGYGDTTIRGPGEVAQGGTFSYGTEEVGGSEPSWFDRTAGAFAVGMQKDPLFGFAMEQIGEYTGGWKREDVEKFGEQLTHSKIADLFEIIGEWGPTLLAGVGLYSGGKAAATLGLKAAAKGATTGQLGKVATRATDVAGNLGVGGTARIAKPGLERTVEIAGGAAGIGTLSGAEETARGGDLDEILKSAALGAGLAAGFEGALFGLGRLARSSRDIDLEAIKRSVRAGRPERKQVELELKGQVVKMRDALDKALQVEQQQMSLIQASGLSPATAPTPAAAQQVAGIIRDVKEPAKEALRVLRAAKAARKQHQQMVRGFLDPTDYTRDVPFNPTGKRAAISTGLAKAIKTPEGLGRELGPTMVRMVTQAGAAETEIAASRAGVLVKGLKLRHQTAKILGHHTARATLKDPRYRKLFDMWEKGGDEAVDGYLTSIGRGHMTNLAREMFDDIRGMREVYNRLVQVGAEPILTANDLQALGVREWLPHVLSYTNEEDFLRQTARAFGGGQTGKLAAQRMLDRATKDGLAKFGSIDHQRRYSGSLADKLAGGHSLVDDPIEAIGLYRDQVHRRLAYGSRFGFSGELKDGLIRQAMAEGANPGLVNTVADTLLAHKYYPAATRRLLRNVTDLQTFSKLALAVIPNMSQTINTVLFNGYRNTARGMIQAVSPGLQRQQFAKATGIAHASYDMMRHLFQESALAGTRVDRFFERAARFTLRRTGFEAVENFNRFVGGTAGAYTIRRDLSRAIAGRLRGNNLDQARRRMRSLGLNLDELTARTRREAAHRGIRPEEMPLNEVFRPERVARNGDILEMGEFDRAIFNAAKQTQFTPDATRLPPWWQTPQGRVVFQFKRFALSQGRFLRDQVLAEASRGNMKPLASFLAIYPIAGEAVGSARYAVRGKDRPDDHVYRFMTNLGYVGGFGLAWDTLAAAKWGRLGSTLAGPAVGDIMQVAETIAQGQPIGRFFTRQPIAQAARAVALGSATTVQGILDLVDQEDAKSPLSDEAIPIQDLLKGAQ